MSIHQLFVFILPQTILGFLPVSVVTNLANNKILQAAWIVDDTDEEDSDSDVEADGMVLDEREGDFPSHEGNNNIDLSDDDQASLNFRDYDEETEVDTVMMVSFEFHKSE